jgi:hypothetical protein
MGDSAPPAPGHQDWLQPGTYSVWAFERDRQGAEPILFVAYEWETAGLRGVRVDCVWIHEEESGKDWEEFPERNEISEGVEAAVFAGLVERGKVHRLGTMPPIGRYAEPPSFLS